MRCSRTDLLRTCPEYINEYQTKLRFSLVDVIECG
jgi:hypothetical protein